MDTGHEELTEGVYNITEVKQKEKLQCQEIMELVQPDVVQVQAAGAALAAADSERAHWPGPAKVEVAVSEDEVWAEVRDAARQESLGNNK